MCDIIAFYMYIIVPSMVCMSRMTNLHRPSSIGRAVALMCILAHGGFARTAPRLACGLACLHARACPNLPRQCLQASFAEFRRSLRYGTLAHLWSLWPWISPWVSILLCRWELWWAHQLDADHSILVSLQLGWYWWSCGFKRRTRGRRWSLKRPKLTPAGLFGRWWVLVSALGNSSGS